MGDFITVTGKRTYEPTPDVSNYCPTSRNFSAATLVNVTRVPNNQIAWDDTYNLTQFTATGAPSVTIQSVGVIPAGRITASIWLQGDATNTPGTGTTTMNVTLTLLDANNTQLATATITVPSAFPDRFSLSAYFNGGTNTVKLQVSWANTAGIVYMDACQIEPSDWATEYIDNSTSSPQARVLFADPSRILGISNYQAGTTPSVLDEFIYTKDLYPYDHASYVNLLGNPYYGTAGGQINVFQVSAGQHVVYRAKAVPPKLTGASGEKINIPKPWYWVMVQGAKAYQLQALYDIGVDVDSSTAEKVFESQIEDMLENAEPSPAFLYVSNPYPRMMR